MLRRIVIHEGEPEDGPHYRQAAGDVERCSPAVVGDDQPTHWQGHGRAQVCPCQQKPTRGNDHNNAIYSVGKATKVLVLS